MLGAHGLDQRAHALPQGTHALGRVLGRALRRGEDAPPSGEQGREARIRPGIFRARDGMAGHQMDALRQVRLDRGDHRALHRADIGHDGAGLQMRRHGLRDRAHRAHRHAEHDEVGARRALGRIPVTTSAMASSRPGPHGLVGIDGDDLPGEAVTPRRTGDGGADQPEADDGDPAEDRRGGRGLRHERLARNLRARRGRPRWPPRPPPSRAGRWADRRR